MNLTHTEADVSNARAAGIAEASKGFEATLAAAISKSRIDASTEIVGAVAKLYPDDKRIEAFGLALSGGLTVENSLKMASFAAAPAAPAAASNATQASVDALLAASAPHVSGTEGGAALDAKSAQLAEMRKSLGALARGFKA